MTDYIKDLSEAVAALHGCHCSHSQTAHVHEIMDGETVWQGEVETFELSGHPRANKAFAWSWEDDDGEEHFVAVLNVPPINSPREAVQAAIASGRQR